MSLDGPAKLQTVIIRRRTFLIGNNKEEENGEVKIRKKELIEVMKLLKGIERKLQAEIDKA